MRRHRTPIHRYKEHELTSIGVDTHCNREHNLCSEDTRQLVNLVSSWYALEIKHLDEKIAELNRAKAHISDVRKQTIMGILSNKRNVLTGKQAIEVFSQLDANVLKAVLMGAIANNHVLSFSQTKKGNAIIVAVYDGRDNDKVYPETIEELLEALETLAEAYGVDLKSPTPPPAKSPKRLKVNTEPTDDV